MPPSFCTLLLVKLVNDALAFAAPLLLGALVACISGDANHSAPQSAHASRTGSTALCWAYAAALFAVAVAKAFLGTQYTFRIKRLGVAVQSMAASVPLTALLRTPAWAMSTFGEGVLHVSAVSKRIAMRLPIAHVAPRVRGHALVHTETCAQHTLTCACFACARELRARPRRQDGRPT